MKVTLEFDGFEERTEALQAQHAVDYLVALNDIENEIRRLWKYEQLTDDQYKIVDKLHSFVADLVYRLPEYE